MQLVVAGLALLLWVLIMVRSSRSHLKEAYNLNITHTIVVLELCEQIILANRHKTPEEIAAIITTKIAEHSELLKS